MQQFIGIGLFNAMYRCRINICPPAVERSRFQQGDYFAYSRKGGKADQKAGLSTALSQIDFFQQLCDPNVPWLSWVLQAKDLLKVTEFEIESFRSLRCFRELCSIGRSPENYPDMFHLWTSHRNQLDVFLTLEKKLPRFGEQITRHRYLKNEFRLRILNPIEFLACLGIHEIDPVPIQPDRFYPFIEAWDTWHTQCSEQINQAVQ